MILEVKYQVNIGDFSDDDWICEDGDGRVYVSSGSKPKWGKIKKLNTEKWEPSSEDFSEIIQLYQFFSKQGIEPKDSVMKISDFKSGYCVPEPDPES